MISWPFIAIVAVVIASLMEVIKKIPIFSKKWKVDWARSASIWAVAFMVSFTVTYICLIGFGISSGIMSTLSYTLIAFLLEKFLGEEFFHRVLSRSAGIDENQD